MVGVVSHRDFQIIKSHIVMVILIVMSIDSYSQIKVIQVKSNPADTIKSIYSKYLLPPLNYPDEEVVSFWTNPNDQPEYALRIRKDKNNQYYLEGRFLTQRIGILLANLIDHPEKPLVVDVKFFSVQVSDLFQRKMQIAFVKTLNCEESNRKEYDPLAISDGICYIFKIKGSNNDTLKGSLCEPEENDPCYKIIMFCLQLSSDLRNQSFKESKYLDKFN